MARAKNAFGEIVGDQAFVVVGESQGVEVFERGEQGAQDALFGFRPKRLAVLTVDAHDLLMARDNARFHCGNTPRVGEHALVDDTGVLQAFAQGSTRLVVADSAERFHARAQPRQIGRDVACPAEAFALLDEIHDGNCGFRRKARSGAPQIAVQHEVARTPMRFPRRRGIRRFKRSALVLVLPGMEEVESRCISHRYSGATVASSGSITGMSSRMG